MKASEYIRQIRTRIEAMKQSNGPLLLAATTTIGEMAVRIFENGEDANNNPIGQYDNGDGRAHELWVADKYLPKNGSKRGKPHQTPQGMKTRTGNKTTYFENYFTLREKMGRGTSTVDLKLTGRLASNFVNSSLSSDAGDGVAIGEFSTANIVPKVEGNKVMVTLSQFNYDKAKGNEEHFGRTIFAMTEGERNLFRDTFKTNIIEGL